MANTLTLSGSISEALGNIKDSLPFSISSISLTGGLVTSGIQKIGTSAEDLNYGDIPAASVGLLFLWNQDPTNIVYFGKDSTGTLYAPGVLDPAGVPFALFQVKASEQVMLQAVTAECQVFYRLWNK